MKITQEQFDKIFGFLCEMQTVCEDVDTSSVNGWLTMVEVE